MTDPLNTRSDLVIKETKAPVKNDRSLPDDEDVTSSIDYTSSDYDATRDRLKKRFSSKTDPSSSSDHLEAEHVQYGTHEPVNQPMPTSQSITTSTASSPGHSPSVSMTKALLTSTDFVPKSNQQAMNLPQTQGNPQAMNPHNSQLQVPSGEYGSYLQPSALVQQHGGSNLAHYGTMGTSPYWLPEQNDIYDRPQLDPSKVVPYGSANRFGSWSYNNPANSRFGYEAGVSSNNLPSIQQHQGGDLDAWRPNEQNRQMWDDISAYVDQQNDRSDPSDQTQQRSPPRDN